jgi:hypothetical protein
MREEKATLFTNTWNGEFKNRRVSSLELVLLVAVMVVVVVVVVHQFMPIRR